MKNSMAILAAGVAALMLGVEAQQGPQQQRPPQQQGGQQQRPVTMRRGSSIGERTRRGVDRDSKLGKEDQRLIESIEEAESLSSLRRYIQQAMNSRSEEVRMAMVEALENANKHSASDFAYFLADSSREVSEAAFSAWASALEEDHGEDRVRSILETADVLRSYSGRQSGQRSYPRHDSGHMRQQGMMPGQTYDNGFHTQRR